MRADEIEVTRPCPVKLAGVDRSGAGFHCSHCDKQVHLLSNRTQAEAEAMLPAIRAARGCVSYRRRADGTIVFREAAPVVPVSRLTMPMRAAAGLALALAACTPHAPPQALDVAGDVVEAPVGAVRPCIPEVPAPVQVRARAEWIPDVPTKSRAPVGPVKPAPVPPAPREEIVEVDGGIG